MSTAWSIPSVDVLHFAQKRALLRVDFNVPLDERLAVTDDTRIVAAIPTIRKILADGGSCVIMSHLGRPRGIPVDQYSLRHIVATLTRRLGKPVQFVSSCIGPATERAAAKLKPGEALLLENLRFHPEEQRGDAAFAEALSRLGNVYVNDAFGAAHRADASVTQVPHYFTQRCLGKSMANELFHARQLLDNPRRPFVAIVGGSKIADKIGMIDRLLDLADDLIVGGGMAYTFIKAVGGDVGRSLVEDDKLSLAVELMSKARSRGVKLHLPADSVVASSLDASLGITVCDSRHIAAPLMGLDIGPEARRTFAAVVARAGALLWNGPMGVFERASFGEGTRVVGEAIAQATERGAYSLVGGGDSAAAAKRFGLVSRLTHVSTGGGALLAYMEGKPLPALVALQG